MKIAFSLLLSSALCGRAAALQADEKGWPWFQFPHAHGDKKHGQSATRQHHNFRRGRATDTTESAVDGPAMSSSKDSSDAVHEPVLEIPTGAVQAAKEPHASAPTEREYLEIDPRETTKESRDAVHEPVLEIPAGAVQAAKEPHASAPTEREYLEIDPREKISFPLIKRAEPAVKVAKIENTTPILPVTESKASKKLLDFSKTQAKPCASNEECKVSALALAIGGHKSVTLTQINRGRLGNHLFQWAALLSIAKEGGMRVVVRDLKYKPDETPQMLKLKPLVWPPQEYAHLEVRRNLCHIWDRRPVTVDSNLTRLSEWTLWGAKKGQYHTPANVDPKYGDNWAHIWAKAIRETKTPAMCRNWELDGFFQQQWFFKDHIDMVRKTFWDEPSAAKAGDMLKWLLYNVNGTAVALHIRLGDYKYTDRNLPMQYYHDALVQVRKHTGVVPLACVIFSDDLAEAMGMVEEEHLCDRHIAIPPVLGDVYSFYMMSLLPNIVIADSSFSFWAARLSPNNPFVVAPEVHKAGASGQSGYEYLMQTPGWVNVNTTTGKEPERTPLVGLMGTSGEKFLDHSGLEADTAALQAQEQQYYDKFASEWAY